LPNGYNYYINEDIVIVKEADQKVFGELTVQTYDLTYIDANAAAAAIAPLLSNHGQVIQLESEMQADSPGKAAPGSRLIAVDYPAVHVNISELLPRIDRKKRQVAVEVKIIETNLTDDEILGINWPKSIAASIKGVASPVNGLSQNGEDTEAAIMPLETGNWQLGYLTVRQLDVVLNYLKKRSHTKLLSNPRLTTLENETATIQIQTVIPIQTVNRFSEGAVIQDIVTFQDEEVGISLEVTPRINGDSVITLRVTPVVEEIIGYTGSVDNQKPITSQRSISTTVAVKNGESLVLGGLLKESRFKTEDKVFLLGSIPLLGGLFTNRSTEVQTTDLLILITPRMLD
jgi:general secretion pathway protein D